MRVACYTSIMGGFDDLLPHPAMADEVDFHAFTDRQSGWAYEGTTWQVHPVVARKEHPRITAKRFKLNPHLFLPDYDVTIWLDGSHRIISQFMVREAIEALGDSDIALYKHPYRDDIYEEADCSEIMEKYSKEPIRAQVDAYRAEGHPEHWGLWACGTIVRRNTPLVQKLDEEWWGEIKRWSYQDQISLPVVLRRQGIRPAEFSHSQVMGNPWTQIQGHHSTL